MKRKSSPLAQSMIQSKTKCAAAGSSGSGNGELVGGPIQRVVFGWIVDSAASRSHFDPEKDSDRKKRRLGEIGLLLIHVLSSMGQTMDNPILAHALSSESI